MLHAPLPQVLEDGLVDELIGRALQHAQHGRLGSDREQLRSDRQWMDRFMSIIHEPPACQEYQQPIQGVNALKEECVDKKFKDSEILCH